MYGWYTQRLFLIRPILPTRTALDIDIDTNQLFLLFQLAWCYIIYVSHNLRANDISPS